MSILVRRNNNEVYYFAKKVWEAGVWGGVWGGFSPPVFPKAFSSLRQ